MFFYSVVLAVLCFHCTLMRFLSRFCNGCGCGGELAMGLIRESVVVQVRL